MAADDSDSGHQEEGERAPELDAEILRPAADAEESNGPDLAHLQAGARVYDPTGIEVAVVEVVEPNRITLRAGFPGRPIDIPPSAVAHVSPDGQRLDVRIPASEIERLVGNNEPGYVYLEAQQVEAQPDVRQPDGDDTRSTKP
jgi:hypothetical protein